MNKKLLKRHAFFLLFFLCSFITVNAQRFTVSGKVTDDSGKPLEGATVLEKGTKNSTVTGSGGTFQLNVSSGKAKN
jgi:hypothetical protein